MSTIIENGDGRLVCFAIGSNKALMHKWTDLTGTWGDWVSLGGQLKEIAVARNKDNRLEVLAIGTDDALWHIWQTTPYGSWSDWANLGGKVTQIAVAANKDGRLEAFGVGLDNAPWHNWQTTPGGDYAGWVNLGGKVTQIAVAANKDGRLEAFGIGVDNALWHNWQTTPGGDYAGWASLGGIVLKIGALLQGNGTLQVFALGSDDKFYRIVQNEPGGEWSSWQHVFVDDDSNLYTFSSVPSPGPVEYHLSAKTLAFNTGEPSERSRINHLWGSCFYNMAHMLGSGSAAVAYGYQGKGPEALVASGDMYEAAFWTALSCKEAIESEKSFHDRYGHEVQHNGDQPRSIDTNPTPWDKLA